MFAEGLLLWDLSKHVRFAHEQTEAQKSQEGQEIFESACCSYSGFIMMVSSFNCWDYIYHFSFSVITLIEQFYFYFQRTFSLF